MTSLDEAWGRPSGPSAQQQSSGRMVGQNYYSGQNRNNDPSLPVPYVGNGMSSSPGAMSPMPEQHQMAAQPPPPPPPQQEQQQWSAPPNISVNVEKSEEERELYRYMRSRLGEMDWEKMKAYFDERCNRKVRRASGKCGCLGVSEHMDSCSSCQSMCHKKTEFRANLTLYLLIAVVILLALNLFFPKGVSSLTK